MYGELWFRVSSDVYSETRNLLYPVDPWFLCPDDSGKVPLGPGFEEKWWSYLCTQMCRHFWEMISLVVACVYVAPLPRISSGYIRKLEDPCSRLSLSVVSSGFQMGSFEQQGCSYLQSQACLYS